MRAALDSPQLAVLCYSPWASAEQFSLFTHLKMVQLPIAWYYPLTYNLGDWKYEYGDTLVCQLWECDGGQGGCDPGKPTVRPSAAAGDDLLGQATLSLGAFQVSTAVQGLASGQMHACFYPASPLPMPLPSACTGAIAGSGLRRRLRPCLSCVESLLTTTSEPRACRSSAPRCST